MSLSKPTLIIASPDIPFQEVNKNESGNKERNVSSESYQGENCTEENESSHGLIGFMLQ